MRCFLLLPFLLLSACDGGKTPADDSTPVDSEPVLVDTDGDGTADSADCDPNDPYTYPGAREVPYDGKDQDCDGDDINDVDGDGYVGTGGGGDDCNDNNPTVNPGAEEVCYNGLDDDCDGTSELPNDCDGDGYPILDDCDEADPNVNPGAEDVWYDGVDSNCDGLNDYDQDQDGEEWSGNGGPDCDDLNDVVNSTADEIWDGYDNDCDGTTDRMTTRRGTSNYYGSNFATDANFGYAFAPLSDLDGNGSDDMAVGVPGWSSGYGKVYVVPILDGLVSHTTQSLATIQGDDTIYNVGAGTLSRGGRLVVGTVSGLLVYNQSALVGGAALTPAEGAAVTTSGGGLVVSSFPDLNGGEDEVLAYSPTLSGLDILVDSDLTVSHLSLSSSSLTVNVAGPMGDLDGDGYPELGISTASRFNSMRIAEGDLVRTGGSLSLDDLDGISSDGAATHISTIGDQDGDGRDEALVSNSAAESSKGRVWLLNAMPTDRDSFENNGLATVTGPASDAALWAGQVIDLDADGNMDLLVCMPGNDTMLYTGSCAGMPLADLYAGGDHSPVEGVPYFTSVVMGDMFGTGMLVEDRDGDGDDDLWLAGAGDTGSLLFFRNQQ